MRQGPFRRIVRNILFLSSHRMRQGPFRRIVRKWAFGHMQTTVKASGEPAHPCRLSRSFAVCFAVEVAADVASEVVVAIVVAVAAVVVAAIAT